MKKLSAIFNGREYAVQFGGLRGNKVRFLMDGDPVEAGIVEIGGDSFLVETGNRVFRIDAGKSLQEIYVNGSRAAIDLVEEGSAQQGHDSSTGRAAKFITASMPGKVVKVYASENTSVKKGEHLIVLEAMKMENEIRSPSDGVIREVFVKEGEVVEGGDKLIEFDL